MGHDEKGQEQSPDSAATALQSPDSAATAPQSADSETTAPRSPRKRHRARAYLAVSLAAAAGATLLLFAVSRVLASFSDYGWFHTGCGILALAGFAGMIGAAVWNGVAFVMRHRGRRGAARPVLIVSFAVFGLVPFTVGIVTDQSPALRPADARTWAGYATTRNGVTQVSATWVQPRVYPLGSRPNDVAFWVGLTYPEGSDVEQIGTEGYCQRHTSAAYDAWYELYPAPPVMINVATKPGDRITATVVRLDEKRFRLTLSNATTGAQFSTIQVAGGLDNTKGAIIVEEPALSSEDLAGFDAVHFTKCAFNGRPLDGFRLTSFGVESDAGTMETTTSDVGAGGFTVTRR